MLPLLTVGHGRASREELIGLLREAHVARLVDVRRFPGSRAHPHLSRDALGEWLPAAGIDYRWEERLGGRRALPRAGPTATGPSVSGPSVTGPADSAESPDTWWTVAAFRAYAAHTRTPPFRAALAELLDGAAADRTVIMCSETVWWRCHRRLIADVAMLAHGRAVQHLMPGGRLAEHRPAEGARLAGTDLVWDRPGE